MNTGHQPQHLVILGFTVIVSLALGAYGGMYYQKNLDARVIQEKEMIISNLRQAFAYQIPREESTPPAAAPDSTPQDPIVRSLNLPKAGDQLCRNTMYMLAWRADTSRTDEIRITLPNAPAPIAPLADVPVSYNETGERGAGVVEWRVGTGNFGLPMPGGTMQTLDLPDGDLYRIRLEAIKNGTVVESYDRGPFVIQTCEG